MNKFKKIFSAVAASVMLISSTLTCMAATPTSLVVVRTDFSDTSIPVAAPLLQYSGTGDSVLSDVALPEGYAYKITFTHDGKSNFIVKFINGDRTDHLVNKIGAYAGTVLLENGSTAARTGIFEIKADGNWTITVSTVTNSSTRCLSGVGDKVSGTFKLTSKNTTVNIVSTGDSNIIVHAHFSNGRTQHLVNEIGAYSGQVVLKNPKNTTCYIEVISNGDWSIDLGYGDDACIVPDIN